MGEVVVSSEEGMGVEFGTEEEEIEKQEERTEKKDGSSEVVRWEKFLPRTMLRVLLVEADDSTRQIISALLRKCSYRVSAVPDGLMAWEALKDGPHNIDLILTEVELPSISGYALLTLVMEHDICKNIPVIMMSSHDSISMVLKCMLKGAADFLIKPVRRNELRNLWQHVWRRQTLITGHIPQNSPMAQHKAEAGSENNAVSNHSSDCASSQNNMECCEKGSDAQGLAQLKCRSASNLSNADREKYEECVKLNKKLVPPETKTGERTTRWGSGGAPCNETYNPTALRWGEEHALAKVIQHKSARPENDRGNSNIPHGHSDELVESSGGAIDLIGTFDNGPKGSNGHFSLNDGTNKFEFTPQLELSLRRFYPSSLKNQGADEKHALNHSNASAFSWYTSKALQPLFPMSTINCTELKEDNSKSPELSSNQLPHNISGVTHRHGATLSSSQEIVTSPVVGQSGQAELAYPGPQLGLIPVPRIRLDNICTGYSQVFSPLYYTQSGLPPAWSPKLAGQREQSPFATSTSIHSNPDIHDSDQNYRQSDETTTNSVDQNVHQQNNKEPVEELRHGSPAASQRTSTSLCNGVANHNISGAHGSFDGGNDGNAILAVAAEKSTAPESLNDGGIFTHDGFRGMDSHRSSQREVALTKFRLKRKDRCYEKKVRYQSRKRLAEQRPRVKGQFVRQVQNDAHATDPNE